jgi:hypothetical protein
MVAFHVFHSSSLIDVLSARASVRGGMFNILHPSPMSEPISVHSNPVGGFHPRSSCGHKCGSRKPASRSRFMCFQKRRSPSQSNFHSSRAKSQICEHHVSFEPPISSIFSRKCRSFLVASAQLDGCFLSSFISHGLSHVGTLILSIARSLANLVHLLRQASSHDLGIISCCKSLHELHHWSSIAAVRASCTP